MGFEVFKTENDEFAYRYRAKNGEILFHSESYSTDKDAERAVNDFLTDLTGSWVDMVKPYMNDS